MKLDNFAPFGRPQSGTVIIQLMTELDVYNNLILVMQKYITDSSLKMPALVFFVKHTCAGIFVKHTLYSLY